MPRPSAGRDDTSAERVPIVMRLASACKLVRFPRTLRAERGQTLIEFAFIAPIIFIFLFTIVDFGIALDRRITLQHAVREGARAAAVEVDEAAAREATLNQAQGLEPVVAVCFCDQDGSGQAETMEPVKVSASFTYHFTIPFGSLLGAIGIPVGGGIEMTPWATSALENDPDAGVFDVCDPTECPP